MKRYAIILIALFCLAINTAPAQTPFEVNNTGSQAQKKIVAADEPQAQTGETKELRGFFKILKGVLDILKAVVGGIIPSANAAEIDEMPIGRMPAANGTTTTGTRLTYGDVTNTETGKQTAGVNGNSSGASAGATTPAVTGSKSPAAVSPDPATGKAVTTGSAKFKEWFKAACDAHCSDWEFPVAAMGIAGSLEPFFKLGRAGSNGFSGCRVRGNGRRRFAAGHCRSCRTSRSAAAVSVYTSGLFACFGICNIAIGKAGSGSGGSVCRRHSPDWHFIDLGSIG